ncbi:44168_t:CDS:2, partial [Gigaspora margarita]
MLEDNFSEDMYDESLIELAELVNGIDLNDVKELLMHDFILRFLQNVGSMIVQKGDELNEHVISIRNRHEFGSFEHEIRADFSFIDSISIETGCTEELYELHQQFINKMEKQLAEQEGRILQSDDENDYGMIINPLKPRTKGRKRHKRIKGFNEGSRKIILTESTNMQRDDNIIRSSSSNFSSISINISNIEGQTSIIQEQ